jgi:hypothetical protein
MSSPRHGVKLNADAWADHLHNLKNYSLGGAIDVVLADIESIATIDIIATLLVCKAQMNDLVKAYSQEMDAIKESGAVTIESQRKILKISQDGFGTLHAKLATIYNQLAENKDNLQTLTMLGGVITQLKRDGGSSLAAMTNIVGDDYITPFIVEVPLLSTQELSLYDELVNQIKLVSVIAIPVSINWQPKNLVAELKNTKLTDPKQLKTMRAIITNCIKNSNRFLMEAKTPEPIITFTFSKQDQNYQLAFQDNGPGIPEEVLEKLNEGSIVTQGGNGIGIAGTRENFLASFKAVDSTPQLRVRNLVGSGAIFEWEFPVAVLSVAASATENEKKLSSTLDLDASSRKASGLNILFVDDNLIIRGTFKRQYFLALRKYEHIPECMHGSHVDVVSTYAEGAALMTLMVNNYKKAAEEKTSIPYCIAIVDRNLDENQSGLKLLMDFLGHIPEQYRSFALYSADSFSNEKKAEWSELGISTIAKDGLPRQLPQLIFTGMTKAFPEVEALNSFKIPIRRPISVKNKSQVASSSQILDAILSPDPSHSHLRVFTGEDTPASQASSLSTPVASLDSFRSPFSVSGSFISGSLLLSPTVSEGLSSPGQPDDSSSALFNSLQTPVSSARSTLQALSVFAMQGMSSKESMATLTPDEEQGSTLLSDEVPDSTLAPDEEQGSALKPGSQGE